MGSQASSKTLLIQKVFEFFFGNGQNMTRYQFSQKNLPPELIKNNNFKEIAVSPKLNITDIKNHLYGKKIAQFPSGLKLLGNIRNSSIYWFCFDVDSDEGNNNFALIDKREIEGVLFDNNIPFVTFKSKEKGFHIYVFFKKPARFGEYLTFYDSKVEKIRNNLSNFYRTNRLETIPKKVDWLDHCFSIKGEFFGIFSENQMDFGYIVDKDGKRAKNQINIFLSAEKVNFQRLLKMSI